MSCGSVDLRSAAVYDAGMPRRLRMVREGDILVPLDPAAKWPWDAWLVAAASAPDTVGLIKPSYYLGPGPYQDDVDAAAVAEGWRRVVPEELFRCGAARAEWVPGDGALAWAMRGSVERPAGSVAFQDPRDAIAAASMLSRGELPPLEAWSPASDRFKTQREYMIATTVGVADVEERSPGEWVARLAGLQRGAFASAEEAYERLRRDVRELHERRGAKC